MIRLTLSMIISMIIFTSCSKNQNSQHELPSVIVAPVIKGDLVFSKEIIGQTKAYNDVDLIARIQGFLTKRLFKEGQDVKKDDLLFEIEQDKYQAALQSAEANLVRAQAQMKHASIEYNRLGGLRQKNAVSQREFDEAEYQYMDAKGTLMNAESKVKDAKLDLSYTQIKAPFDGQIGATIYSVGNFVGYNNTKLANIVSVDPMRVQFNISELILITLDLNDKDFKKNSNEVLVHLQFQNGVLYQHEGDLYFADNKINTSTGTIMVEALFPNPERYLIPGMYVKVILQKKGSFRDLVIPQNAVQETQAGPQVLVVGKDGLVSLKMIKTGIEAPPNIQVTSGLSEGDLVITEGMQYVRPGSKVNYTVDKAYAALLKQ